MIELSESLDLVRDLTVEVVEHILDLNVLGHPDFRIIRALDDSFKFELIRELGPNYIEFLQNFRNKARGTVTPIEAEKTGLVPAGWNVETDMLGSPISLDRLDFSGSALRLGEDHIPGSILLPRALELKALGGLWFAKEVLEIQKEGKFVIPKSLRGERIILPCTTLRHSESNNLYVPTLNWHGNAWSLDFCWLNVLFHQRDRLIRAIE